ncbi:MAG: hypothetical protein K0U78_02860 [Actinomycetia bacterium]|nr:hypothetical protein [Actinomycetes bacterium]
MSMIKRLSNENGVLNVQPSVCYTVSGGSLIGTLGSMSRWNTQRMVNVFKKFNSSDYVGEWSLINFLFKGYMFTRGVENTNILSDCFSSAEILNAGEVIVLLANMRKDVAAATLCSTKGSSVDEYVASFGLCEKIVYCYDNICKIHSMLEAAVTIPLMLPPKNLFGHSFVDGGTLMASPFTLMEESLKKRFQTSKQKCSIMYFLPHITASEFDALTWNDVVNLLHPLKNFKKYYQMEFGKIFDISDTNNGAGLYYTYDNVSSVVFNNHYVNDIRSILSFVNVLNGDNRGFAMERHVVRNGDDFESIVSNVKHKHSFFVLVFDKLYTLKLSNFNHTDIDNILYATQFDNLNVFVF